MTDAMQLVYSKTQTMYRILLEKNGVSPTPGAPVASMATTGDPTDSVTCVNMRGVVSATT